MVNTAPQIIASPVATSNDARVCMRKLWIEMSLFMPMTEFNDPVMPMSVMYPVPCGSITSSAVMTWVCVPKHAEALPSTYQPKALFSEVASAWKSTMNIFVSFFRRL